MVVTENSPFCRIASGLDVGPLLRAVQRQPALWGAFPLRTAYPGSAHQDVLDILLRFADLTAFRATGNPNSLFDGLTSRWYPPIHRLPEARPLVSSILHITGAESLGRVILTKLPPGGHITLHCDEGAYAAYHQRWQCPLQSDMGNQFQCGAETVVMLPGELWTFRTDLPHQVWNRGAVERISLIVDVRPMAWGIHADVT